MAAGYYSFERFRTYGPGAPPTSLFYSPRASDGVPVGDNLIGFKFSISGNTHYGWAEIEFANDPELSLQVNRWAYKSEPDDPIGAGQVPGAGVAALTLLGLGAAGMRQWRKRKETADVESV